MTLADINKLQGIVAGWHIFSDERGMHWREFLAALAELRERREENLRLHSLLVERQNELASLRARLRESREREAGLRKMLKGSLQFDDIRNDSVRRWTDADINAALKKP